MQNNPNFSLDYSANFNTICTGDYYMKILSPVQAITFKRSNLHPVPGFFN